MIICGGLFSGGNTMSGYFTYRQERVAWALWFCTLTSPPQVRSNSALRSGGVVTLVIAYKPNCMSTIVFNAVDLLFMYFGLPTVPQPPRWRLTVVGHYAGNTRRLEILGILGDRRRVVEPKIMPIRGDDKYNLRKIGEYGVISNKIFLPRFRYLPIFCAAVGCFYCLQQLVSVSGGIGSLPS